MLKFYFKNNWIINIVFLLMTIISLTLTGIVPDQIYNLPELWTDIHESLPNIIIRKTGQYRDVPLLLELSVFQREVLKLR